MTDQDQSSRRSHLVLIVAGAVLLIVLVIVVWRIPRTTRPRGFSAEPHPITEDVAAVVALQIDSIDAAKGQLSARVSIGAGPAAPAEGVKVAIAGGGGGVVTVKPDEPVEQTPSVFDFDRGSVTSYPFDRYRLSFSVAALPATSSQTPGADDSTTLPIYVAGNSSAFGFVVYNDSIEPAASRVDARLGVERTLTHRIWASGMMAVDWALALTVLTVVFSIVWRARNWETRHLAWLGSMIFALAAFRNTAPGGPPLGVFMDTAAFFWAEALIVLALVTLVVIYLARPRSEIDGAPRRPGVGASSGRLETEREDT